MQFKGYLPLHGNFFNKGFLPVNEAYEEEGLGKN